MSNEIANVNDGPIQAIEQFTKILNTEPSESAIIKTPDGKAETLHISHVEARLDEIYLRQWGDESVNVMQIANELLVWLTLWVIDPQTKNKITRTGAASAQIMVDKAPEGANKNTWALDMANKKPNAMKLAFSAAVSLARKNAAKSLGVIFGRNINRKHEDEPGEFYQNISEDMALLTDAKKDIHACIVAADFSAVWQKYPDLHENEEFKREYLYYHRKNIKK